MEEAERIRQTVEGYFHMRYSGLAGKVRACFDSCCTGKKMEREEKRYGFELERAREEGLTFHEWELELNFVSIKIRYRRAWVEVEEKHRVVFDATKNTISTMKGLIHNLKLKKRKDDWYIVDHRYYDELRQYLGGKGIGIKGELDWRGLLFKEGKGIMKRLHLYNRDAAVRYAHRWALDRNPKYYDFDGLGGDCTNFCSQVIHAGDCPMNNKKWSGWYYHNLNDRSPSWTGVEFFYKFLINNRGRGPQGEEVSPSDIKLGDIVQLDFSHSDAYNHSLVVVSNSEPGNINKILISCHTIDRDNYPLIFYSWRGIRFIHIKGYGI
jgi:hypothetical protein